MRKITTILFLLITTTLSSQSKIDSLLDNLNRLETDSLIIEAYLNIGIEYKRVDQEKALGFFKKAESLSIKTGSELSWAKSKYRQGNTFRSLHQFELAEKHLDSALFTFEKLDSKKNLVLVKTEFGSLFEAQNKYEASVNQYIEALKSAKKIEDKNSEARIYNYLGSLYRTQKQYSKALKNYEEALSIVEALNFKPGISACLNNISIIYKKMELYEVSISYLKKALILKKETQDKLGEALVLSNIGELFSLKKEYGTAENYFTQALFLFTEVGNPESIVLLNYRLATNAYRQNNITKSIAIANNIIKDSIVIKDITLSTDIYKLLSDAHQKKGDLKQALNYAQLHKKLSDSLYNKEIVAITNSLEARFENEQKTNEIELLKSKNDLQLLKLNKQENEQNFIIAITAILLILLGLLYYLFRTKQKSNQKLTELDTLKSNFFANISHEFRTPLTLIKGPIEKLEQNPNENLSIENVKMIRRNTNRLLNLVNQLLDLSKIDEGNAQLESTEGDIYKCLRAAAASFNSHAAQRNIDYRVKIPQTELWASFDRDKLEKIVYNLLSNAFKFCQDHAHITIIINYDEHDLQIKVSDSGKGIPKDKLPFIFDRFYQVDNSNTKEIQGSGIGLSLSKDLVELMDGTITVSSQLDKGSFFTVHIPIQEIKTRKNKPQKTEAVIKTPNENPFNIEKIDTRDLPSVLLIEDNKDMRHFIKEQLVSSYKIIEAFHGVDGKEKALQFSPDLIITDLMMPKMDGVELCKTLKTNVITSHIPIIMLTAKAGIENKIEGLETGADDYLVKPFNVEELLVRCKNLIVQREKLRQIYTTNEASLDPKKLTVNTIDELFLNTMLQLLENEFSNSDFGVVQMQKNLLMSKSQLHRKLKALTNESPGELLRNFRLKRAAQLLSQKADSVTQIAYKVGFNNLSYFAKCFKEMYGVSPSSYLKSL